MAIMKAQSFALHFGNAKAYKMLRFARKPHPTRERVDYFDRMF
jgi:hypothetical protein